jgi:hypothetical protein
MPKQKQHYENNAEYQKYSVVNAYQLLRYIQDHETDNALKSLSLRIDNNSEPIQIYEYMKNKVIPYFQYFNSNYSSSWINGIYNLHIPNNKFQHKSLKIDDIKKGLYLKQSDDGKPISITTEMKYLKDVINLDTIQNLIKNGYELNNLDVLITFEPMMIYDLLNQAKNNNWTLSTLNGKLKALRRYYKLMLGDTSELRIKYSTLYTNFDDIYKFKKGLNVADGNDVMFYDDLLKFVDMLENDFKKFIKTNGTINKADINNAFKANINFLAVAVFVWDYPSRSDKWETTIINDDSQATNKTTYLVVNDGEMSKWIFRKNVKNIGRANVIVPLEKDGLNGLQDRLDKAIKLSIKLFPRTNLFVAKNSNFKPDDINAKPVKWNVVSGWVRDLTKQYPILNTKVLGIDLFRRSFVSYWNDVINANQKKKLQYAMLTSADKINTYYLRRFTSPELKNKVKLEYAPQNVIVNNANNVQQKIIKKLPLSTAERQRIFVEKHKDDPEYIAKRRAIETNPRRQAVRVVRELNQGIILYNDMKKETILKYKIVKNGNNYETRL